MAGILKCCRANMRTRIQIPSTWRSGDRESCRAGIPSPEAAIILPQSPLQGVSVDRDANLNLSSKDFYWNI